MKLICKTNILDDEYDKKMEEYDRLIDIYDKEISRYGDDPILSKTMGTSLPEKPFPITGYSQLNVKDELILGYEYLQKKYRGSEDQEIIKIYFNANIFCYEMCIIKYDDKIIKQLDELLVKN
jgi:hypothetical protein